MSKKGTSVFIFQRASAVLLAPLALWFLFGVVSHLGADYGQARAWLANPINGLLFGALIAIGAMHMRIGLMEVIHDYIHSWVKGVFLLTNWLIALGVIATVIWSIYNISFAG